VFDGLRQIAHILSTLPLSKLSDDQRDQIRSSPVWLHLCSSVVELKVGILLRAHFKESLRLLLLHIQNSFLKIAVERYLAPPAGGLILLLM
jgi:hypothetical protein